jgi:O-antigen ligase
LFLSYSSFFLLFIITLSIVDSLPRLRWVLFAANLGVALGSIRIMEEWRQTGTRAGIMVYDSNYFATSAVLVLPFAFFMVLHCKRRWERLSYGACLALSLFGITLCASRGGFLALLVASLHLVRRSSHPLRNLVVISVVLFPLMFLLPVSPMQRFLHPGKDEKHSEQSHLIAWRSGLHMIEAHPFAGVGLGRFRMAVTRYMDIADEQRAQELARAGVATRTIAHNTYLEVAAELGLPALVVFASILFFVYRSLERACKRARAVGSQFLYDAARGLQAGFVGFLVGAFTISAEYTKFLWLVIFLSMCLPSLAPRLASSAPGPTAREG